VSAIRSLTRKEMLVAIAWGAFTGSFVHILINGPTVVGFSWVYFVWQALLWLIAGLAWIVFSKKLSKKMNGK